MKGTRILLGIIGVLAIALVATPMSQAQCTTAKEFASYAGGTSVVWIFIDPAGLQNSDSNARFWEVGNPGNISTAGGGTCTNATCCPASEWWDQGGMIPDGQRGIRASLSSGACDLLTCPPVPSDLMFVIEDSTADGSDAGFIAYRSDQIATDARQWDLGRTEPAAGTGSGNAVTHTMERFPTVDTQSSSGPPPNTTVTNDYSDIAINYHGVGGGTANTALPANTGIANIQILGHQGSADPGRERSGWNQGVLKSIPYGNASVSGDVVAVACGESTEEVFLGVGLEFIDGEVSALVGSSTAVECDPTIAEPEDQPRLKRYRKRPLGRSGR